MTERTPSPVAEPPAPWWVRPGLDIDADGRLRIAGEDAEALARAHGTPLFVYDRARFAENARRLQAALAGTGLPFRVRFALKANPLPEILEVFRGLGAPGTPESVGIDACSPGEVERAIECGWRPDEISYTGTNVSERDLDVLLPHGIHLNLDAISQIERYGRRAPGTAIGIRIDPGAGAGYNEHLEYAGDRPTKFGIGLERLDDAIAAAARHDLRDRHGPFPRRIGLAGRRSRRRSSAPSRRRSRPSSGCAPPATRSPRSTSAAGSVLRRGRTSRRSISTPTPRSWRGTSARSASTIACEPGDQLTKDGAILLGEVVTVERRRGVTFVGLDIGWNVNCSYFIYRFAQELVVCRAAGAERTEIVTVAGHINEAGDVFAEDYAMPPVEEGDMVALLNAGGYLQAMSSTHCLRPMGEAVFLDR